MTKKIGEYRWAMSLSSNNAKFSMLNFELIEGTSFDKDLDEKELKKIDDLYRIKVEIKDDSVDKKIKKSLQSILKFYPKNKLSIVQ